MFKEDLQKRLLPATVPAGVTKESWSEYRKDELALFMREEYGITPEAPAFVRGDIIEQTDDAFGGKAYHRHVKLSFPTLGGEFAFPFDLLIPKSEKKVPAFLYISFRPYELLNTVPYEEILDEGFAFAVFSYNTVTADTDDGYSTGLAALYPRSDPATDWSKIGMWAFAASRVLDYLETVPEIDAAKVTVGGHSRLGKTAIWCAAQDERFAGCISNDSGCSGAAVSRDKIGESIARITKVFPYWSCGNYKKYADNEHAAPFDQHNLLSLIAPRCLYVASASEDSWADPQSEYMGAVAASEAWELFGEKGIVNPTGEYIAPGEALQEGKVAYHLRPGTHFIGRFDWVNYLRFFKKQLG